MVLETTTGWQKSTENNGLVSTGVVDLTSSHLHVSFKLEQSPITLMFLQLSAATGMVVSIETQWYCGPVGTGSTGVTTGVAFGSTGLTIGTAGSPQMH